MKCADELLDELLLDELLLFSRNLLTVSSMSLVSDGDMMLCAGTLFSSSPPQTASPTAADLAGTALTPGGRETLLAAGGGGGAAAALISDSRSAIISLMLFLVHQDVMHTRCDRHCGQDDRMFRVLGF